MGCKVYANGREVSARKNDNKAPAGVPDVVHSPPPPPPTPKIGVPTPYLNFSYASDTADGTKTVKIGGGEVGIKNKSCYKTSTGHEAATPALNEGLLTKSWKGKTYFSSWSSDVKFEKKNAVRHLDMTTHNHNGGTQTSGSTGSDIGGTAPPPTESDCEEGGNNNDAKRGEIDKIVQNEVNPETKKKYTSPSFFKGGGMATMKEIPDGKTAAAFSRSDALYEKHRTRLGLTEGQLGDRKDGTIKICDEDYTHKRNEGRSKGVCTGDCSEARLLYGFSKRDKASSLVFKVDVKKNNGEIKTIAPCAGCFEMMCHVRQHCNVRIFVCRMDNKPEELEKEDCDKGVEGGGWEDFVRRVEVGFKPGQK